MSDLRKKDRKWLEHIELASRPSTARMYPGWQIDLIPEAPAHRLWQLGFITTYIPHNPAHKERWIITPEGKVFLAQPTDNPHA